MRHQLMDERRSDFMKRPRVLVTVILASSLISGCMVGPNYHRPVVQTPTAYRDLSENPQAQAQAASYADLRWWQVFQDPQLQELIRTALKQNYDLQLATERIIAARAQLAITRSSLFPQVQGGGNFAGGNEQFFPAKSNLLTVAQTRRSSSTSSASCEERPKRRVPNFWQPRMRSRR
jgi:outer membrane protein TolC